MRRLLTKKDIIITALVLVLGIVLLIVAELFPRGSTAVIKYNGEITREIPLEGEKLEITVNGVTVCRENGEVFIESSDCKDKICVRSGRLSKKGDCAVCAPRGVSVEIKGKSKKAVDAVTG